MQNFPDCFFSGFFFLLYFLKVSVALYIYDSILCHQIKFFSDFNSFCGVKYNTFMTSWCLDDIMATTYSKNSKLNLLEKFLRKMDDRNWFHWRKDLTVILEYVGMLGKLWLDSKMLIRMDFFFLLSLVHRIPRSQKLMSITSETWSTFIYQGKFKMENFYQKML